MADRHITHKSWYLRALEFIAGFSSTRILVLLGLTILTLTMLIYLAEHGHINERGQKSGFTGLGEAIYFMVVTATTTAAPKTSPFTKGYARMPAERRDADI